MHVRASLRNGFGLMVPLAIACSIYLYLYPFFNRCAFPLPSRDPEEAFETTKHLHWPYRDSQTAPRFPPTKQAPFRLLALGDPQLEGDTSIPIAYLGIFPHVKNIFRRLSYRIHHDSLRDRIRVVLHDVIDIFFEDIPFIIESCRKRFDLFGNDFYLAHIYRTIHWWTRPTHVSVLGDLVGSQWIENDEFDRRGHRFWNRTFRGGERVPDDLAMWPDYEYNLTGLLDGSQKEEVWAKRIMNVAGNHDIGYAGDLTPERMERFERIYGKANYELRFELPITDPEVNATVQNDEINPFSERLPPELRIIVLNDMNLDTPAKDQGLQDVTYRFINAIISTACAVEYKGQFTLILTHIPLYKPAGVCVDGPFFDFHGSQDGGGVKEQYLLSGDASKGLLEGIFGVSRDTEASGKGLGRPGLILNGHDHEGCDTFHFVNQTNGTKPEERSWEVRKWQDVRLSNISSLEQHPGRREITVRSMMGDFGGNAGLFSMWFNQETWEWEHEFVNCPLGRQHFWWMTHFLIFGVMLFGILYVVVASLENRGVDVDSRAQHALAWVQHQVREFKKTRAARTTVGNGAPPNGAPKKGLDRT
ncbi:Metallophosphoesterase domain protein [Moelleriella libera RCEF 2490]|uniref:Metallophosphoesterase domain protein n=1 Tax=Moelleriella libera RCEF 2490 TaxID=1081109 RepID=A0A162J461_9HYPO|nr:Metallophosphoesterase domain protein [Moelleriella libera RCEF 2490]